jgi:hypothetical protein
METYIEKVKTTLYDLIHEISKHYWLYVSDPKRNFSRDRKLPFEKMIAMLVSMGGGSLRNELIDYFHCSSDMASAPAFVQRRAQLLPEALEYLFHRFTEATSKELLYKGYRLLAADGSDLQIFADPEDTDSYYPGTNGQKHYSMLHINAFYDILSRTYQDILIQKGRKTNENAALVQMTERSCFSKAILIADRNYEAYNGIAHMEKKGWKYLIRIRDTAGIIRPFHFKSDCDLDIWKTITLTRKQSNAFKRMKADDPARYRCLPNSSPFDYIDLHDNKYYDLNVRFVRFRISEDTYETVITNLAADEFPAAAIKHLYNLRWGIETSFRELKYTIGLKQPISKKTEYISQEIFARCLMYNFCELVTSHVAIHYQSEKYVYQTNFSAAVHICRLFLRGSVAPPDAETNISRNLVPVRPNRKAPRNLNRPRFNGFLYKVA